ncbi:hypothetical protein REPUB_Repub04eG0090400 [Reevesia pubescens]
MATSGRCRHTQTYKGGFKPELPSSTPRTKQISGRTDRVLLPPYRASLPAATQLGSDSSEVSRLGGVNDSSRPDLPRLHHGRRCPSLRCGHGISVKDLGEKYFLTYFHNDDGANSMKDLEEKYSRPYFHNDGAANSMKDLKEKYFLTYFHNDGGANSMKDLEEKYSRPYFHNDGAADSMKDLEEKYFLTYFHNDGGANSMKDLEEKYSRPYFHNDGAANSMKDLEEKYSCHYFHKDIGDQFEETKSPHQPSSKLMKDHNMEHQHHVESAEIGLFAIDDLRAFSVGQKLRIFFPIKDHSLYPPFLPKEVADIIPFSSSHASNILQFFSVSPDSPKGKAVQDTLRKCELDAAEGETKICATSFESLHGFLRKAFGPEVDFKFISTSHPTITTPTLQNYTVLEPPREIQSAKKVACHPLPYLYAIYFCHFDATETKTFKLPLVGDSGDKVEALVVCHMDTSGWSSNHVAFRMLGIKHGNSVCHVFAQGNLVYIQQPSPIVAM